MEGQGGKRIFIFFFQAPIPVCLLLTPFQLQKQLRGKASLEQKEQDQRSVEEVSLDSNFIPFKGFLTHT